MQVAGDKAAISGVRGGVSSAGAGAETIGVVGVGAEVGIATAGEIGRTGSIVGVFGGFEIEVGSSGKS
jgi:hypothetical protein